jgi:methylenetetrahydrofolate dehydrogenase (NADP+) / methenyltetrahydrofolate cyclohydrolase
MGAQLIDGKAVAAKVRGQVAEGTRSLRASVGVTPGLAVVRVGEDPASKVYVGAKRRAAAEVGFESWEFLLPQDAPHLEVLARVQALNADPAVHGILVQLPLPRQVNADAILAALSPDKDVDGFHPLSVGNLVIGRPGFRPCTPAGVMRLLEEYGVELAGKRAVVVGRSNIVGKPMALMLLAKDATVTICHRKSDLAKEVGEAEVLVVAAGVPELVKGEWIRPGAVVIDVGINRTQEGKLVGDVAFAAAAERASLITPVPGGVGPMTVAMLLKNTLRSAQRAATRG